MNARLDTLPAAVLATGRYAIFANGRECGEERWRIEAGPEGIVVTGEQVVEAPHPYPSRLEWRATLTSGWRVTGYEVLWQVGERRVHATHAAERGRWHARIEHAGTAREQQGDYPEFSEVELPTALFAAFLLARRDFATGGEHEFPVLRIGPPWMAVSPERMLIRCVESAVFASAVGPVSAKRYVVSLPPRPESEGYSFWADEQGIVLESHEGLDPSRPWMRLLELWRRA